MKKIFLWFPAVYALLALFFSAVSFSSDNGNTSPEIYVFVDSECEECVEEYERYVSTVIGKYDVSAEVLDISDIEYYEIFLASEEYFNRSMPMGPVIIFYDGIMGKDEIVSGKFEEKMASQMIRPMPPFDIRVLYRIKEDVIPVDGKLEKREVVLFSRKRCKKCDHVLKKLELLRKKYPDFSYEVFYVENKEACLFYDFLSGKINIPEDKVLTTPAIIAGDIFLEGSGLKFSSIENSIRKVSPVTAASLYGEFMECQKKGEGTSDANILKRFGSFTIAAVFTAGLIDGINPCAFGAIIFFVTCLWAVKKEKKDIIFVGIFFIGTVFITYLLMGMGILRVLEAILFVDIFERLLPVIYSAAAFILFILAGLSLLDFLNSLRPGQKKMVLALSEERKRKINGIISRNMRTPHIVAGAVSTAFAVSILEAVCTGQVYLPTILYVINVNKLQGKAFYLLFLYNTAFVIPLILIFFISFSGAGTHFFTRLLKQDITLGKALLFICFLTFAVLFFLMR